LYADHTQTSEKYNVSSLTYGGGGAPDNFAGWMLTWNYPDIRSSGVSSVQREAEQHLGRPWVRMAPPIGVIKNTFADKTNDSRYDGTFTSVYRGNWPKAGNTTASLVNANGMSVVPGGAVLTFLDNDDPAVVYTSGAGISNVGAGTLPGRADYVVNPNGISRIMYPGLWKLGPYRTDNGTGLGQPNAGSTRPFPIAKFSEFYFIAAEAAVKGATTVAGKSAVDLINVIRARAGKWRWDNNGNIAKVQDNSAAMTAATPATIDINYILAERSREFYGEGYRWFDLVRTQKWAELAGTYSICGTAKGDHTPVTYTRTIGTNLYLRPIPQGQIDLMEATTEEKQAYQNPGY
jgi:starch-binding outer membrane protein, SusD/RagB family